MRKNLTKRERLSNKKDIATLFGQGKKIEGECLRLVFLPARETGNRFFVTVRRGFRTAVARNRQKRLLREIFRTEKSRLAQGFDIGFVVKKEVSSFLTMQMDFLKLLDRAKLLGKATGETT